MHRLPSFLLTSMLVGCTFEIHTPPTQADGVPGEQPYEGLPPSSVGTAVDTAAPNFPGLPEPGAVPGWPSDCNTYDAGVAPNDTVDAGLAPDVTEDAGASQTVESACGLTPQDFITCNNSNCDAVQDVTLPAADVVGSRGFVLGDEAVVQVLFASAPFAVDATRWLTIVFDKDGNPETGGTGGVGDGRVWAFEAAVNVSAWGTDHGAYPAFPATTTLASDLPLIEVRMPLAAVSDLPGEFRYALISDFGGSFGNNDASPEIERTFFTATTESFGEDALCGATAQPPR